MTNCKHRKVYGQQSGIFYKEGANYNITQIHTQLEYIIQAELNAVATARCRKILIKINAHR